MKTVVTHHRKRKIIRYRKSHRYPNAAERGYYMNKLSDGILTVATSFGIATIFIFLFFMA